MRCIIFILLPLVLFSQNKIYPDTVVTIKGKTFSGLITAVNESVIELDYGWKSHSSMGLNGINKIIMETLGTIYDSEKGFTADMEKIQAMIQKRKSEKTIKHTLKAVSEIEKEMHEKVMHTVRQQNIAEAPVVDEKFFRFSFGAFWAPYSRTFVTTYYHENGYIRLYETSEYMSHMTGRFAYLFTKQWGLALDLGYDSRSSKNHIEEHYISDNDSTNSGDIATNGLKTFSVLLNIKYYFSSPERHKVSPYLLVGFGKQFSSYISNDEVLFEENPSDEVITENYEEYITKLNSPYIISAGFGAEYYFSESLSVFSIIRFSYRYARAEYQFKKVYNDPNNTYKTYYRKTELSKGVTKVGLGLNFYF